MNVQIITIGDEILIGQTIDTNSAWMGQQLNLIGANVTRINSISDEKTAIINNIRQALEEADIVLMTGGLGPTKDDITKQAIAAFFGVSLEFHQPTYDRILQFFKRLGRDTTPAHKEQCYMPTNATILTNKMGTAPGMWFEYKGKVLVSMPGVPYEMKYLMEYEVIPKLRQQYKGLPIAHRTLMTVGEGESRIARRLETFENELPDFIKLAFLPSLGAVRLRLTGIHKDEDLLHKELDYQAKQVYDIIPELVYGKDNEPLEEVVGKLLIQHQKTLGTAESCTGGYVAHRITSIPGSSAYFHGSVVAYANSIKTNVLNVSPAILNSVGAVSQETVEAMVKGLLDTLSVDIAVAISGIAGPGGGTPEKPVGTIWLAIGDKNRTISKKINLGKKRLQNIEYTGTVALNMVRQFVLGMEKK